MYMYIYTQTCIHICIYTYMYTCICTYIHTNIYTYTHIHTHIYTYIHTHTYTYIHTYIHTYILTYTHTYTHYIIIIISVQPLGRSGQRPEFSQATGMALVRCILGKLLGVACHCFPPLFRRSHFSPPGASTSATT